MDLSDVIEDLENIDNLENEDLAELSSDLYELSTKIKADVEDKPELLAEAELLLNYKSKINNAVEEMKNKNETYNNIINDIYHIYGLGKLDGIEMMQIAAMFKDKMRERFKEKDKYKIVNIIKREINNNKKFFHNLKKAIGKSNKKLNELDSRGYIPRTNFGRMLVDEFSKESDDLQTGISDEDLEKLKDRLGTKVS